MAPNSLFFCLRTNLAKYGVYQKSLFSVPVEKFHSSLEPSISSFAPFWAFRHFDNCRIIPLHTLTNSLNRVSFLSGCIENDLRPTGKKNPLTFGTSFARLQMNINDEVLQMSELLFQRILLPVDFAPISREAFLLGLRLAHQFQAQVFLLHVIDTKSLDALNALGLALPSEEKAQKKRLNHQARHLARGLLSVPEAKGLKITRIFREGKPFIEIVRTVRAEKIDLVVMGSYGGQTGDISHMFFGSTAEKIVRTVTCPVFTVPYHFKNLARQMDIKASSSTKKQPKEKVRRSS